MDQAISLHEENQQLREQLAQRDAQIVSLKEQIKQFLNHRFSASSEKLSIDQLGLFNEAEAIEQADEESPASKTVTVKSHKRQQKPRVSIPADYPREEIVHDLPESEKYCPHDGTGLEVIGSEDHEQLEIIPAQISVLRHRRLKYACPCCQKHIVTADKPKQPIEKSIASPGLLAYVAVQKYADALPLYRQSEMFKRIGITLDRTNLATWMVRCGELVQPVINLLMDHLQQQPLLHLDETTLQVLEEPGKTAQSKSYLWLMAAFGDQPAMVFHYDPTRNQQVPMDLLSSTVPAIMVDGYEWYQKACDTHQITRLGCWAHARRKFVEAQKLQTKGKTGRADQALAYIQKLYAIEKKIKDEPPEKRFNIRQREAKPIVEKLQAWMEKSLLTVAPQSAVGKALGYLHNQWDRLVSYLGDGLYPIDNNAAERAIRPFTIGRKNWMFSKSQAGAKASANLYSLVETAKANQLNPYDYLKHIFKELPNANNIEDVEALLPWHVRLD